MALARDDAGRFMALGRGTVADEERRRGIGDLVGRGDDGLVGLSRPIELPRRFEQLEELFNDGYLVPSRDDADDGQLVRSRTGGRGNKPGCVFAN